MEKLQENIKNNGKDGFNGIVKTWKQPRLQDFLIKMRTKGMPSFKSASQNKKNKNKNTTHVK